MTLFDRSIMSSYWRSIITMALSCIISKIKRDVGRKSRFFFTPHLHSMPMLEGDPHPNIAIMFDKEKLERWVYRVVKKFDDMFSRFDTIPA